MLHVLNFITDHRSKNCMCTVALKKCLSTTCTHTGIEDSVGRFVVSVTYNTNPLKQA